MLIIKNKKIISEYAVRINEFIIRSSLLLQMKNLVYRLPNLLALTNPSLYIKSQISSAITSKNEIYFTK